MMRLPTIPTMPAMNNAISIDPGLILAWSASFMASIWCGMGCVRNEAYDAPLSQFSMESIVRLPGPSDRVPNAETMRCCGVAYPIAWIGGPSSARIRVRPTTTPRYVLM